MTIDPKSVEAACKAHGKYFVSVSGHGSWGVFLSGEDRDTLVGGTVTKIRKDAERKAEELDMSATLIAAAPFIRAQVIEELTRSLPPEIRHWDAKREFYRPDKGPETYDDRERAALEELRRSGDTTKIVINEGDWLALMDVFGKLRALADVQTKETP